jgi:hypothetical protein
MKSAQPEERNRAESVLAMKRSKCCFIQKVYRLEIIVALH